ncbi:hypothetical protein Q3G72_034625 [Acer saccharum]|nr:hypothetical protein Q3G72_034625 [Acer saccharum]
MLPKSVTTPPDTLLLPATADLLDRVQVGGARLQSPGSGAEPRRALGFGTDSEHGGPLFLSFPVSFNISPVSSQQVSFFFCKVLVLALVMALFSAAVSVQDLAPFSDPAAGAGVSLPVSGAFGFSFVVSASALI